MNPTSFTNEQIDNLFLLFGCEDINLSSNKSGINVKNKTKDRRIKTKKEVRSWIKDEKLKDQKPQTFREF
jgi:hypothetical protein